MDPLEEFASLLGRLAAANYSLAISTDDDALERWQALRQRGASDEELQREISYEFSPRGIGSGYDVKGGKHLSYNAECIHVVYPGDFSGVGCGQRQKPATP